MIRRSLSHRHPTLILVALAAAVWPGLGLAAAPAQPPVLVVHTSMTWPSIGNQLAIVEALAQMGIPTATLDVEEETVTSSALAPFSVVVLSDVQLDSAAIASLTTWVETGGGLLATGRSAFGLEAMLGLGAVSPKTWAADAPQPEVRFEIQHPVSHGGFWQGPSMSSPPIPPVNLPMLTQFLYPINPEIAPAFRTTPGTGSVVASWYADANQWGTGREEPAIVVGEHGRGRTVYSGPLPGAWRDFGWPRCWQVFMVNAVEWLSARRPLLELGLWPDAHLSSLVWTGDASLPEMVSAVPAVLAVFDALGLERFGTFYLTAFTDEENAPGFIGIEEYPGIVGTIAAAGSEVAGHADIHVGFNGQPLAEQRSRLETMVSALDELLEPYGEVCRGFRAPFVDFDESTRQALGELGLYDSSDMQEWTETTFPHFAQGLVWEAPPAGPMDYEVFTLWNQSNEVAEAIFTDRLDYIRTTRGMYPWLCHPEFIADGHLPVLHNVLAYAQDLGTVWLARQDDVLDWWLARKDLTISQTAPSSHRVWATVTNGGPDPVSGVSLWLRLPARTAADPVAASSPSLGDLEVLTRQHNGMDWAVAVLPTLEAGASVTIEMSTGLFSDGFESGDFSAWGSSS